MKLSAPHQFKTHLVFSLDTFLQLLFNDGNLEVQAYLPSYLCGEQLITTQSEMRDD